MDIWYLLAGVLLNGIIGIGAYKKQALRLPDGIIAAALAGIIVYLASIWVWLLLMLFFALSSVLSKVGHTQKADAMAYAEKGDERDAWQVMANGGVAMLFALIMLAGSGINGQLSQYPVFAAAAAIAAAASDTWSTEIGTSSQQPPVWILNWHLTVPAGTSGGVTSRGTVGAMLGSLSIAIPWGLMVWGSTNNFPSVQLVVLIGCGFIGSIVDSLMGATLQAVYYCPSCNKLTEKRIHHCGMATEFRKGQRRIDNDVVNFLATVVAAGLAAMVYVVL